MPRDSLRRSASLLSLALLAACGGEVHPPHVVIVSLDTVRADRWAAAPTPCFDGLAARADRYPRAVATAPWTLPTHASMFTGRYPDEHGAVSFAVDELADNAHPLHPSHVTLAEVLAGEGYVTAGFVANTVYLSPRHGLDQGFDTWRVRRARGPAIVDDALEWLDGPRGERPVLLFVNFMDAHRPYNARPTAAGQQSPALLDALIEEVMVRGAAPGMLAAEVAALYDEALGNLDAALGQLLDGLEEREMLDDALVIVTSDHGEAFGEHGIVEHSKDVIEPLLRVPFVVKRPGQTAGVDRPERASSVDVAGLVADGAGLDLPDFPRRPGGHAARAANRYSRPHDLLRFGERFRRTQRVLYDGDLKLVVTSAAPPRLYDVAHDPKEEHDLAAARPAELERMLALESAPLEFGPWPGPWLVPGTLRPGEAVEMGVLGYGAGSPIPVDER